MKDRVSKLQTLSAFILCMTTTRYFSIEKCTTAMAMKMTTTTTKKRILCLHGRSQSAQIFRQKISGTRRKLERVYDLHFLDAPIIIPSAPSTSDNDGSGGDDDGGGNDGREIQRAWWNRDDNGRHVDVQETFEYVIQQTQNKNYDAILGFSQGGLLGTALVMTGRFPSVKAVLTAGSPWYHEPFTIAEELARELATSETDESNDDDCDKDDQDLRTMKIVNRGKSIPKLHFAGETDAMVPTSSVEMLCNVGGTGRVIKHDKGHMFPTKAVYVSEMLDFLDRNLNV